jgi:hypothetical protein
MSSTKHSSNIEPPNGVPRVSAERWIFVGDDVDAFSNQWLKSFAEMHTRNRIEGHVLDLTRGRLWAALDLSRVSKEVYDDIALLVVEPEDAKASKTFLRLTHSCDPNTALNEITTAFDSLKWPKLAEACSGLARLGLRDLDSVGKWLKAEAERFERARNRRPQLRMSIDKLVNAYPNRPTWDNDLVRQAHKNQWPAWAVEGLPSLYIPLPALSDRGEKALLWHYILACVPRSYKYEVTAELCDGHVIEADLTEEAAAFVRSIAPTFEQRRICNLDSSDRSTIGVVTHTMSDFQMIAKKRHDHETAKAFEGAQRRILEQAGIIKTEPNLDANLDAIIGSLEKIAVGLEPEQERGPEFHILVEPALELYPGIDLDQQAGDRNFPAWSIPYLSQNLTSDGCR